MSVSSASSACESLRDRVIVITGGSRGLGADITVPIAEPSGEDWERVVRTKLTGPFYVAKHAAAIMGPKTAAGGVRFVLTQPDETVVPEITVLPMRGTSWP